MYHHCVIVCIVYRHVSSLRNNASSLLINFIHTHTLQSSTIHMYIPPPRRLGQQSTRILWPRKIPSCHRQSILAFAAPQETRRGAAFRHPLIPCARCTPLRSTMAGRHTTKVQRSGRRSRADGCRLVGSGGASVLGKGMPSACGGGEGGSGGGWGAQGGGGRC
jgi:hypothetical protein